ncbi:MAG: hypothetical protein N2508_14710 [Anaerolineae bacterium]|nr:hypothetical protein [Anaerolineae bacterium]
MKNRTPMLVTVGLLAAIVLGLAAALARCPAQPAPATTTVTPPATRPPTWTPIGAAVPPTTLPTVDVAAVLATAAALGQLIPTATPTELPAVLTAWAEQGTVLPTSTPVPPTPAPTRTPIPTPTMTAEEQLLVEEFRHNDVQSASSPGECSAILETQPWCNVTQYAKYITRPEWKMLFPTARFLLIEYDLYGGEFVQHRTILFAEQDGQRYLLPRDLKVLFDPVVVTDENRELVARALVLMLLPDYLRGEIVFSDAREIDKQGVAPYERYNYAITAWTQIRGLKIEWWFVFYGGHLIYASGEIVERNVGEYIDVPPEELAPGLLDLEYKGF